LFTSQQYLIYLRAKVAVTTSHPPLYIGLLMSCSGLQRLRHNEVDVVRLARP